MSSESAYVSGEFRDCDAYFDAINDVNVRFTLQGLESTLWKISSVLLPRGIHVQYCWSGSGALAQGVSRSGGYELAIPASGHYTANGRSVPVESALFMVPGSEFLVSIPKTHCWFGVFVPESLGELIGLPEDSAGRVRSNTRVLRNAAPGRCSVPELLRRFFENANSSAGAICSRATLERFENELLAALGTAYGYSTEPERLRAGRPALVDQVSVGRALDVIEASPAGSIAISELVRSANVSERSLREGFRKYLGLTPTRYMQLRTFNRARRRLAESEPRSASVTEIASELGVWDLGRFAARYRQLFGELPSRTLQRAI